MPSCAVVTMPWVDALQTAADIGYEAFEVNCVPFMNDVDAIKSHDIERARAIAEPGRGRHRQRRAGDRGCRGRSARKGEAPGTERTAGPGPRLTPSCS